MTHPVSGKSKDKILVELIEADVDIGFGLVDDARTYRASGQAELTSRALLEAASVLADIEKRMKLLGASESSPFRPLVAELRSEIAAAESDNSEI